MKRLESISKDLVSRLRRLEPSQLHHVLWATSKFTLARAACDQPIVQTALAELNHTVTLAPATVEQLEQLVDRLDEEYYRLQEQRDQQRATPDQVHACYLQARAIGALIAAASAQDFESSADALGDASDVFEDRLAFLAFVESVLP